MRRPRWRTARDGRSKPTTRRIGFGSDGTPNVMVANNIHDPPTPLINALSVWLQIPDARLLIADSDGHQSLVWSRCAYEAQLRFLRDPRSAPATTLCPD
ncbi:MAG TPA: alpha/beta hydrolase [Stellaceae bacterium]